MKKILALGVILTSVGILGACSSNPTSNSKEVDKSGESTTIQSNKISKSETTSSEQSVITELNTPIEVKSNNRVMYTLTIKEVKDVTKETRAKLVNDSNYLDFYSNGQAQQAVQVSILMKNSSGETLGLPFLDSAKIVDKDDISAVGGWKNEGASVTEFGYYQLDSENNPDKNIYEIKDGESKIATSTVLLSTISEQLKFTIESTKYNQKMNFNIPIIK